MRIKEGIGGREGRKNRRKRIGRVNNGIKSISGGSRLLTMAGRGVAAVVLRGCLLLMRPQLDQGLCFATSQGQQRDGGQLPALLHHHRH